MSRSWTALLLVAFLLGGCRRASPGASEAEPNDGFDRRALVTSLTRDVVLATYAEFDAKAAELAQKTGDYAASPDDERRKRAQQAWRDAMTIWQLAEITQFGPAAPVNDSPGGADFRDRIYSWPTVNPCAVDQELVRGDYANPQAFAAKLPNVRGLDAMEYLLFKEGADNACTAQATINLEGHWQAIVAELGSRRAAYAAVLAAEVHSLAEGLVQEYTRSGGFVERVERADRDLFPSSQDALNAISSALFYLDGEVKDSKLAVPAGLSATCASEICPERLESRHARQSKQHIRQNLVMFRRILMGGEPGADGLGFDDLLMHVGAQNLADYMRDATTAAIGTLDAIEEPTLAEALTTDLQSVRDVHPAIKAVTDELKTRFISVLDLELPTRAEGDND